jgi:hypothetical protein
MTMDGRKSPMVASDPNELVPRTEIEPPKRYDAYTFRFTVVDESGTSFELECAPTVFTTPDPDDDAYILTVDPDGVGQ